VKRFIQVVLFIFTLEPVLHAQTDAAETLVRQSVANYEHNWRAAMQWGYKQTDVTGKDGGKETTTSEIFPLEGTPYERVVAKDGRPLSPEQQAREEEKFQKELNTRRDESTEERQTRIGRYEKQREFIREIPKAYDFRLLGEENVAGRPAWVVTLTPKPGYVPQHPHADMLKHIEGKLWIDKEDLQWAKAEAHIIDTISIGLILARIGPGAHITIDMARVAPGLWMPTKMTINGTARVLLVHTKNLEERLLFTDYHRAPPTPASTQVAHVHGAEFR